MGHLDAATKAVQLKGDSFPQLNAIYSTKYDYRAEAANVSSGFEALVLLKSPLASWNLIQIC